MKFVNRYQTRRDTGLLILDLLCYFNYPMNKSRKKVSVVTACYNESANIQPLYERITKILKDSYELEIIYVDNDSWDNSPEIYKKLAAQDSRVKVIFMSRNFGTPQTSYFAGLEYSTGDAIVLIDGDLQDPPEIIPKLLAKWEEGYDVVYGIRKKRQGRFSMRLAYKLFYRVFKKLAYISIPLDAGEFGLMDRKVVDKIKNFPESEVYIRGLRAYTGFKQTGIEYTRETRRAGHSTTSFIKDIGWAKKLIINFSYKPLEWISIVAFIVFILAVTLGAINLFLYLANPNQNQPSGTPTIIFAILLLGSAQLLSLSIIAEYLSRISLEVKKRPRYIIKEILNDN